jgi:hypothetical protein
MTLIKLTKVAAKPFIQVQVIGNSDRKVAMEIAKIDKEVEKELGGIVAQTALNIAKDTKKPGFPVQTGTLKTSYQADARTAKRELYANVGSDIDYAPNVELGIGQLAQPYFEPAVNENEELFNKAVENLIKKYAK